MSARDIFVCLLEVLCAGCVGARGGKDFVMVWPDRALAQIFAISDCPDMPCDAESVIPDWFNFRRLSVEESMRVLDECNIQESKASKASGAAGLTWAREAVKKVQSGKSRFYSFA